MFIRIKMRSVKLSKRGRFYLLNYFIELVVVMVSVTTAFALNNWAQTNRDNKVSQEYIESLLSDIDNDIKNLQFIDSVTEQKINELVQLIILLKTNQTEEIETINEYVRNSLENITFFHPSKTTYESIKQAGQVRVIKDLRLKNNLVDLYESHYAELRISEEIFLDNVRMRLIPFVMENYENTEFEVLYPDNLFDYRFTNLITQLINNLSGNLRFYREASQKCELIQEQLQPPS